MAACSSPKMAASASGASATSPRANGVGLFPGLPQPPRTASSFHMTADLSLKGLLLLVSLAWTASADVRIFPHRLHLAEGIECPTCHAAACKSTPARDKLIPGQEVF